MWFLIRTPEFTYHWKALLLLQPMYYLKVMECFPSLSDTQIGEFSMNNERPHMLLWVLLMDITLCTAILSWRSSEDNQDTFNYSLPRVMLTFDLITFGNKIWFKYGSSKWFLVKILKEWFSYFRTFQLSRNWKELKSSLL